MIYKNIDKYDILVIATVVMVVFLIIFTGYEIYNKVPKVRENVILATTKQPEKFTELYFDNHKTLPSLVKVGKEYLFEFNIHNLEEKTMEYPYEVYIETNGKKNYIEKKSLILNQNNSVSIKENFIVKEATKSAVVVNLLNKNQEIRFWIEGTK